MGEPHAGERRYKDVLRCCNILYASLPNIGVRNESALSSGRTV
jgi:hypothetical protein